jgi:hypothetical protein
VQKDRVYYVRESLANLATSVARESLLSLGTCLGKFTKTGKFRMHITALDVIAPHARYKVWVKANGEMPFLYGGHVVKAHVGRWSEDCPEHQGVVVLSMNDTPLVSRSPRTTTTDKIANEDTGIRCHRTLDRRRKETRPYRNRGIQTGRLRRIPPRRRHAFLDLGGSFQDQCSTTERQEIQQQIAEPFTPSRLKQRSHWKKREGRSKTSCGDRGGCLPR